MQFFERLAHQMPLELFVLVGNFLEEVISPIPSFMVLLPAGAVAEVQQVALWRLGELAVISGIGRICGALLLYSLARKFEQTLLGKKRSLFDVTHADVTRLGRQLKHSPRRNWTILFLMNALPIFPTAALSLTCGFVKVPFRMFLSATFAGSISNALVYLSLGYAGFKSIERLQQLETTGTVILCISIVLLGLLWFRYHRSRPGKQSSR